MFINKQNNYEHIINEAGNTIFENIYKNCQNEIKDLIITKLLSKIQQQNEIIKLLEKDNQKLKDNLIYILKRILTNKEEEYNSNNYNYTKLHNNSINKYIETDRNSNIDLNITERNLSKKNKPVYSLIQSPINLKYKININESFTNFNLDNEKTKEAKAKIYLNNLIRNNFGSYTDGTQYKYFINKDKSIFDEIFPKTTRNKKKPPYISTFSNNETPKKCIKLHRRYKSTNNIDSINEGDYDNILRKKEKEKLVNLYNKIKYLKIDLNKNELNNKKKLSSIDDNKNKKNKYYKRNIKPLYNIDTEATKSTKIIKNKIPYFNRSPYLKNKF